MNSPSWVQVANLGSTPRPADIRRLSDFLYELERRTDKPVIPDRLGQLGLGYLAGGLSGYCIGTGAPEYLPFPPTATEPGVGQAGTNGRWHSGTFTWDGEVIVAGWEPGGGAEPECEATDPDVDKSMFFYDANTGAKLGQWVLPRPQSAAENCTIHNFNIVLTRDGRDIAVSGNYQAGTWVTEFTNPAAPVTVAWSDPPPLVPTQLGGAWSSYWYNNFVYESEITKGLMVFRVADRRLAGARQLSRLNPQTQEFTLP
jgi:hypothetical protein